MVDTYRGPDSGLLLLDAGDSLLQGQGAPPVEDYQKNMAEVMMRAYGAMGMDGVTPGKAELSLGYAWLKAQGKTQGVDWLCANLRGPRGKRLGVPRKLVQTGGVKLGLTGVVDLATAQPEVQKKLKELGFRTTSPEAAVKAQLRALKREGAEVLVLLAHTGLERARQLVQKVPQLHLVLVGGGGSRLDAPMRERGTFLMEGGRRGRELVHLELRLGQGWGLDSALQDDSPRHQAYHQARTVINEIRQTLKRGGSGDNYNNMLKQLQERAQEAARAYRDLAPPAGPHHLAASLIRLDDSVHDNPAVRALVDGGRKGAGQPAAQAAPADPPVQAPRPVPPAPQPPPRPLKGAVAIDPSEVR
jgi:2',3'-cyclic-nucleotide 2'-phosphodiesterase (5'-nucleotidase family)